MTLDPHLFVYESQMGHIIRHDSYLNKGQRSQAKLISGLWRDLNLCQSMQDGLPFDPKFHKIYSFFRKADFDFFSSQHKDDLKFFKFI